ncbi:acyl-CoA-binding domain-containing protein 4 isoform X4 [Anser cygnoides]|uniref:acyl-CoA-binding domain-containing protein 4 isoform X4 n=1 Tax=Anser cygnoides TaxID=8845 RepID=UPI0034D2FA92
MAEPGCGAQFRAAVRVIQGLPRSGSYRPSYEEMLRFYSYYKQATAGRCQGPRPGFWDPIGRYKWDAWHSLGRMSKEEAMAAYVAEMKKVAQKVIDTVPMDEATREMFKYFEPLYEVIRDMPRPPEDFFKGEGGGGLAPAAGTREGSQVASDSEGEVFCDTLEQMEPEQAGQPLAKRGLSPNSAQAGPEPRAPRAAGRGERGEGRRRAGRSGTGLAAPGADRGCASCACCPAPLGPWLLCGSPAWSAVPRQREPRTAPPAASRCPRPWLEACGRAWAGKAGLGAPGGAAPGYRTTACSSPPCGASRTPAAPGAAGVCAAAGTEPGALLLPRALPVLPDTAGGSVLGAGSATLASGAPSAEGQEHGPPPRLSPRERFRQPSRAA